MNNAQEVRHSSKPTSYGFNSSVFSPAGYARICVYEHMAYTHIILEFTHAYWDLW